jgi:hypothetical protein
VLEFFLGFGAKRQRLGKETWKGGLIVKEVAKSALNLGALSREVK